MKGSKLLSFGTMAATLGGMVVMILAAILFPQGNRNLFLCLAAVGIFLLSLRFNLYALRNEKTERLMVENNLLILVSVYMGIYFINECVTMPPALYFSLLGGLGVYLLVVMFFYVRRQIRLRR